MTQKATPENNSSEGQAKGFGESGAHPKDASTALKEGLVDNAHDISDQLKHVAGDVLGEAKKAADLKLGSGKDFAAEHLGSVADALRHTGRHLRSEESALTDYVEKAASSVDMVSGYLRTRTLSQLIGDLEVFARREPAVFLGSAFVAGLLGGRFMKSATPPRVPAGAGSPRRRSPATQPSRSPTAPRPPGRASSSSTPGTTDTDVDKPWLPVPVSDRQSPRT